MKFIYLSAKKYPGSTADHHYILNLAKAFSLNLADSFRFVVCNSVVPELKGVSIINLTIPALLKRTIYFFFWLPVFIIKEASLDREKNNKLVFFSNDQNLLALLIFWKFVLGKKFDIVADWHLKTETWRDNFIARNADLSITTSNKLKNAIQKHAPFSRVKVVYGGVSLDKYNIDSDKQSLRQELNLPSDKFLIGYVGLFRSLHQEKGLVTMIDSLQYLSNDEIMVFVGGKSEEIEYYSKVAKEKGLSASCVFLPIQPFEKVVMYEKAMDVLSIPYPDQPHFRNYGFPMKVYEYLASGVPIVYTKLELVEEVLADCAYGIKPDDALAFAGAIKEIIRKPFEAKEKAKKGLEFVAKLDWKSKAEEIFKASGIISPMLNISNRALKYILFQRTEFSIYQSYPALLRMVMNKKFHIYNLAIKIESMLLPTRTKRLFSLDMEREYSIIKNYLIKGPRNILDIGCGVAGIDIMLNRHYVAENQKPNFYLLDKSEVNSKVYYGIEKHAAYYNSLGIAKELLEANGVEDKRIFMQEVDDKPFFPNDKFDLVISLISWGFHYPISTYLEQVYERLNVGGQLIVDVRKGTDGFSLLEAKFGSYQVIYEARKHQRLLITKK